MKSVSYIRKPEWYEKRAFVCKKCNKRFWGVKILFFTKCPRCGSLKVIEDPRFVY